MSKNNCIERCTKEGYSFAGVQFGNECFCGEKVINDLKNNRIDEERCNKPCPGEPTEYCGGYLTMNIYHTGSLPSKVVGYSGSSLFPESGKYLFEKDCYWSEIMYLNGVQCAIYTSIHQYSLIFRKHTKRQSSPNRILAYHKWKGFQTSAQTYKTIIRWPKLLLHSCRF